jgi:hypothetical protein
VVCFFVGAVTEVGCDEVGCGGHVDCVGENVGSKVISGVKYGK